MFVLGLGCLAVFIWALVNVSSWMQRRQIKRKKEEYRSSENYHHKRYRDIDQRRRRSLGAPVYSVADQLDSAKRQQERQEHKRSMREKITIGLVFFTAVAAFGSDWIFYKQLSEMQYDRRAWVGPFDANIVIPLVVGSKVNGMVFYTNSGKEPGIDFDNYTNMISYSKEQWNNGSAATEIKSSRDKCFTMRTMKSTKVAYPNSGPGSYSIFLDSTPDPKRGLGGYFVTDNLINGDGILTLQGCLIYYSAGEYRHSSFCYFFDPKITDHTHLPVCTIGSDSD